MGGIPEPGESGVLIVTIDPLRPAFEALEDWNREQGCDSYVVSLPGDIGVGRLQSHLVYLSSLCRRYGVQTVLLGGNHSLVPLLWPEDSLSPIVEEASASGRPKVEMIPTPTRWQGKEEFLLGRASVGNLDEAWDFVNACRIQGITLDLLIPNGGQIPVATLLGPVRGLSTGSRLLAPR